VTPQIRSGPMSRQRRLAVVVRRCLPHRCAANWSAGVLVDALAVRFDVPVMAMVAGAVYGKTTALTQAIRANDTAPRGIDA
jgi:hypothetical protein